MWCYDLGNNDEKTIFRSTFICLNLSKYTIENKLMMLSCNF